MVKRILLIAGFVAISVLIAFGLWYFFFRAPTPPSAIRTPAQNVNTGQQPATTGGALAPAPATAYGQAGAPAPQASLYAQGGLTLSKDISANPTLAPSTSPDGQRVRFYDQVTGQFFSAASGDEAPDPLSSAIFPNVSSIAWAPTEDKAILEFPDGSNVFYDFAAQQQVTLPKHWTEMVFTEDSTKIIGKSIGVDPSNRWLLVANPDGSGATPVQELGNNADKVTVAPSPAGQVIAFSKTGEPQGFGRQEILLIGAKKENFKSIIVEGLNFEGRWTPDGTSILYSAVSATDGYRPSLWMVDGRPGSIGNNRRKLNVSTWTDKCTFKDATTLYCAVPTIMETGAGLQRSVTDLVSDELWRVDLTSGSRTIVAQPNDESAMTNLTLTEDGSLLRYTDSRSGALREIRLTP